MHPCRIGTNDANNFQWAVCPSAALSRHPGPLISIRLEQFHIAFDGVLLVAPLSMRLRASHARV